MPQPKIAEIPRAPDRARSVVFTRAQWQPWDRLDDRIGVQQFVHSVPISAGQRPIEQLCEGDMAGAVA